MGRLFPTCRRGSGGPGFTLIELLVVIAIIALLVTILVPSLSEAKGLALISACGTQMHGVGIAIGLYASHYDMDSPWLFLAGSGTGPTEDDRSDKGFVWCKQPGNPALALCHPEGPTAHEWFIDDASPLFCPADEYNYQNNYEAYPAGMSQHSWGTYRYGYKTIHQDDDPYHEITHWNGIQVETTDDVQTVVMYDSKSSFAHYEHYQLLRLNGVVDLLSRRFEELAVYLWGPTGGPRPGHSWI